MKTIEKLSILIPAYNEGATIHLILDKIRMIELDHQIEKEIVIVNDCSKDMERSAFEIPEEFDTTKTY